MKSNSRPFMAELQRAKRGGTAFGPDSAAPALDGPGPAAGADGNQQVLDAIAEIGGKLDRFLSLDHSNIEKIQVEIADISGRIKATKREMASLRHPLAGEDRFQQASEELQSVVNHTELATNKIMASAEVLDDIVQELKTQLPDGGYHAQRCHDMHEAIVKIYEACNFQDLTGQRITRVVRTLAFIEERVESMMGLWNQAEFEAMPLPPSLTKTDGDLSLTGPADKQDEAHISQADIDALFD